MKCVRIPAARAILCGPEVVDASVEVGGRTVYFDFDERFGPLVLLRKGGKPRAKQPGDRDPFWPEFQDWFDARRGLAPQCRRCKGTGSVCGPRIGRRDYLAIDCPDCNGKGRRALPRDPSEGEKT